MIAKRSPDGRVLPATIGRPSEPEAVHDVIVVGGGVAGLAGALTLSRARRDVIVLDSGVPRNAPAAHTHGYLTRDGESPLELLRLGSAEIRTYGNQVVAGEVATIERRSPGGYRLGTAEGATWNARRVLVATGLLDELPAVPGVRERWGRDVVHCPYCFGWEIRDRPIGVLATRQGAYGQALMWRQWSDDIVMFRHTAPPPTPDQAVRLAARGIEVVEGEVERLETVADALTGVRLAAGSVVQRRVMVVPTTLRARTGMLDRIAVQVVEHELGIGTHVQADASGRTDEAGVWVAGNALDITAGVLQAAASGVDAAAAINTDLTAEDTTLAMERGATIAATA